MAVTGGENTETVVLRKRQVFSPTTPRTRAERDFGLRLARTPTNAPSNVVSTQAHGIPNHFLTLSLI
jgi:hypothetical protein